ncbi:glycosyltransferase family 9 protein [Roseomonas sp. WA12]
MSGRVLVIKLAALGDFVQAFGPFAAIRAHHPGTQITLLTTPPFAELARRSPWFDEVWTDGRPRSSDWRGVLGLARRLRAGRFGRVYDLQTSSRSSRYRWLVGRGAEWSGIAWGSSHPHANPARDLMHTVERQREQLEMAGVSAFPAPDLSWLDGGLPKVALPGRFALLVPGASPSRPGKRWAGFPDLAGRLGMPVVVAGGPGERGLAAAIGAVASDAVDLTGRTSLLQLAAVARRAAVTVGNDTGPTHLAAAVGCPTLALFGGESDPALCAPRGAAVEVIRREPLSAVPPEEVAESALRIARVAR